MDNDAPNSRTRLVNFERWFRFWDAALGVVGRAVCELCYDYHVLRAKPVRASFRLLASPNSRVGYLPVTDHLEILGIAEISCTDEREGCRTAIGNNQRAFRIAGATVASNGRRGVLGAE